MNQLVDILKNLEPPWNMIVLVVLISCVASVVKAIAKQCRAYASHREEVSLKRELVERGLSVDEIERVIAAKLPSTSQSKT